MFKKLLFCWLPVLSSVALAQIPARPTNLNATRTGDVYQIADAGLTFTGVAVLAANTYTDASIDALSDETSGFRLPRQRGNSRSIPSKIIKSLPDGTYFGRVQTEDHSFQRSVFVREDPLPKPVILSATGVSSTSIKLVMPEMFSPNVKRYLYGSEDGIDFQFMDTHIETEFVHKNLASNHTYYYKVIFFNGISYSEYSDVVQATTLSAPEITGASVPAVNEDSSFAISLNELVLISAPGYPVDYNLFVNEGDHYDVKDGVITPAPNFNGTLSVPVKIASAVDESNVFVVVVTVLPVNDAPSGFALMQPQNNSIVESPVVMKWQPASDVDGDPILYSVHITADGADQIVETGTATELAFNIDDYPALWSTEVLWYVTASDSQTDVNSPSFSFRYVVTGIEETTDRLGIYPNPVESSFAIRHLASTAGPSSICDVRGTVVRSAQINRRDQELTVNVATLEPGVYILRIMTSDGVQNYKFVKR